MSSRGKESSDRPAPMRAWPFFFSRRFFLLFAGVSLFLLPLPLMHPAGILVPLLVDGLLLVVGLLDYRAAPPATDIFVDRLLPYPPAVDRATEVRLEIRNRSNRRVRLLIEDDTPHSCRTRSLPVRLQAEPGELARASYHLTPHDRGTAEFGDIHFWSEGPLGLAWRHGSTPAAQSVKCYPGLALIEQTRLRVRPLSIHETVWPLRRRGEGTEFDSLRDYTIGDDARLIHWSSSARRGKPVVRQNRLERGQTLLLVLDAGRMMTARVDGRTKFDHGLDAALLLAYAALSAGDKVGFMVVAQDLLCSLQPAAGNIQFGRILDTSYALQPALVEPRFHVALSAIAARLKRRSLVVVFTDLIDERASMGLLRYSLGLLPRHLVLVVAMGDPEVTAVADQVPRRRFDLYRQGVASELLERRARLLVKLTAAGVLVLDSAPQRISAATLDRYIDIKSRGML